jgi:hypothetical protein
LPPPTVPSCFAAVLDSSRCGSNSRADLVEDRMVRRVRRRRAHPEDTSR